MPWFLHTSFLAKLLKFEFHSIPNARVLYLYLSNTKDQYIPPGFKAIAALFSGLKPVKRAKVPGRANDEVENMMGITPELFTCQSRRSTFSNFEEWCAEFHKESDNSKDTVT